MDNSIDISERDKAAVLSLLWNASTPFGIHRCMEGITEAEEMTIGEASELLERDNLYFEYIRGRVINMDLSGDTLNPTLYDMDNGEGAAAKALGIKREDKND